MLNFNITKSWESGIFVDVYINNIDYLYHLILRENTLQCFLFQNNISQFQGITLCYSKTIINFINGQLDI